MKFKLSYFLSFVLLALAGQQQKRMPKMKRRQKEVIFSNINKGWVL
jgi:hypothetical protein